MAANPACGWATIPAKPWPAGSPTKDNPYFSRMAVNRLWDHFFGRGFVSPVDDFSENNPPSHPELLNELAREMVAHNFDLKFFIKAITASDAYQRSSRGGSPSRALPLRPHAGQRPRRRANFRQPRPGRRHATWSSIPANLTTSAFNKTRPRANSWSASPTKTPTRRNAKPRCSKPSP